jgi:hypothetical protein
MAIATMVMAHVKFPFLGIYVNSSRASKKSEAADYTYTQPSMSRLSRQCGILNISQPYRPPRPVTG